jgi:hypothetical protein
LLFHRRDMAAITSPDYQGERLIVCRNGELAAERRPKRSYVSPPCGQGFRWRNLSWVLCHE